MLFSSMIGSLLVEAKGCSNLLAIDKLREATIEFCRRTQRYRKSFTTTSVADSGKYSITSFLPVGTKLWDVLNVTYDSSEPLPYRSLDKLNAETPDWSVDSGTPELYTMEDFSSFTLVDKPSASAVTIGFTLALLPSQDATAIDDDIAEQYRETLLSGAKYRLLLMNGQDWSNPNLAAVYKRDFETAVGRASLRFTAPLKTKPVN